MNDAEKQNDHEKINYMWKRSGSKPVLQEKFPYLSFPLLEQCDCVRHCFTTRQGGVSEGEWSSLNLSFNRGDDRAHVLENFRRVAQFFDTTPDHIVCSMQTHTTNVRRVGNPDAGNGVVRELPYTDVDGLITNEPGLVLATFYADCVPLYFVDPVHRAIGLSHSGWRGTVAGMGAVTIQAMREAYGSRPEDLLCAIGPSICQDCYEVSEDVALQFLEKFLGMNTQIGASGTENMWDEVSSAADRQLVYETRKGKYQLNLWEANRRILLAAGVKEEHLQVTDLCTCCNHERLFSHRYTNGRRGNLGAFLMLV